MSPARIVLAVVLVAVGLVWIGQGTGLIRGSSFMVGDVRWAIVGLGCVVAGVVVVVQASRSRLR
jgi:hypothetical protein